MIIFLVDRGKRDCLVQNTHQAVNDEVCNQKHTGCNTDLKARNCRIEVADDRRRRRAGMSDIRRTSAVRDARLRCAQYVNVMFLNCRQRARRHGLWLTKTQEKNTNA